MVAIARPLSRVELNTADLEKMAKANLEKKQKFNNDRAQELFKEFDKLKQRRAIWESHWEELAEHFFPDASEYFHNPISHQVMPGAKKTRKIYDTTPLVAVDRFVSILSSLLTPPNQQWHSLRTKSRRLKENRRINLWIEEVVNILFDFRNATTANFHANQQVVYRSLGVFGTGALFLDTLESEVGLRYQYIPLNELVIAENYQHQVDTVFREYSMSARQAVQQFGPQSLPQKIREKAEQDPHEQFKFLHVVKPRQEVKTTARGFQAMPWASFYLTFEGKTFIEEGGYRTMPYLVSRYNQSPNEIYGRSVAMMARPTVKTLYEQVKTHLTAGHRAVNPPLLLHNFGVSNFSMRPGAANPGMVSKEGRPLAQPLAFGDPRLGIEFIQDSRFQVRTAFFETLFEVLLENPRMTATEVLQRAKERSFLLSPALSRQEAELLGPLIIRELDLIDHFGVLPQIPEELLFEGGGLDVEYDSPFTRMQRSEQAEGFLLAFEQAVNMATATQDPTPLFQFNMEKIVRKLATEVGAMPESWLNEEETIQEMKQALQQQRLLQAGIEAGPAAAGLLKAANDAGVTGEGEGE